MSDQQPPSTGLARLRARISGREETKTASPEAIAIHARVDQLSELELRDVMTPRVDVVYLTIPVSPEAIAEAVRDTGHSCFPVVVGDLDEVEGVLFVNDLFRSTAAKRAIGVSLPTAN
jgi:CBS domain containing-hemolysin-like protein